MAIAIVEDLWGRIRAHIDDKITAAATAAESAVAAAESAEADRVVVEQAATSASWSGDRLTVLGVTSPPLTGEKGDPGADGTSVRPVGTVTDSTALPASADRGEGYVTEDTGHMWVWSGTDWVDVGPLQGPPGEPGRDGVSTWGAIEGKPDVFPPEPHAHPVGEVEGLDVALAGKADTGHRHTMVDVEGLDSALAGKATKDDVTTAVAALVDGAPDALDTLGEIATELNENATERAAITNTLAGKADTVRVDARPATWLWDGVEPWIPPDAAVAGDVVLNVATGAITQAVLP